MSATPSEEVRYGNLRQPKIPGLFGLSLPMTLFLVAAAPTILFLGMASLWWALIGVAIVLVVVIPSAVPTRDGWNRFGVLSRRARFARGRSRGRAVLSQGLLGHVPDGRCALPGVGAVTSLSTQTDALGRVYGLIQHPKSDLFTVVIQATPAGTGALDVSVKNDQVAQWASWLGELNKIEDLVGVSVVIETVPDSGQRLERALDRGRADAAPEFSQVVREQIRELYRTGSPTLTCRIALTLSGRVGSERGKKRKLVEVADEIGDLLPVWTAGLESTGAGSGVLPCTAENITDYIRTAYDPGAAEAIEEAQLSGEGTGIDWADVGPLQAVNEPKTYRHEGALSRTWQMREVPRGVFFAESLRALLAPSKDIARKRVCLLFRPESPAVSAHAAELDVKAARFKATQNRHAKAGASLELQAAEKSAQQEALGAPMIRVGLLVTITTFSEDELRRADRTINAGLAPQARIALRCPTGSQDFNFAAGLPLGVVPQIHLKPSHKPGIV